MKGFLMKKYFYLSSFIFFVFTLSTVYSAQITPPYSSKTNYIDNALPQTGLYTIFSNNTTGYSEVYDGKIKLNCHTWTIDPNKRASGYIMLEGSLDNVFYYVLDNTTSFISWKRDIVNKGARYIRANVFRSYTGIAPEITIKYQGGCN